MWLSQTFYNLEFMEKEKNTGAVLTSAVFRTLQHVENECSSEATPFRRLSKHLFRMQ